MSSDDNNGDTPSTPPRATPRARVRTRTPPPPASEQTNDEPAAPLDAEAKAVRVRRRRRLNTDDTPTPPPERHPMDPGPTVSWPALPRDPATGEIVPEDLATKSRGLFSIDRAAGEEFILETLHMLLLQHRPTDDIARLFGVHINTVYRWRKKLREKLADDFRERTPSDLAAEQVGNIKRTKAHAWQQAARCTDALEKLRWVTMTLRCEQALSDIYKEVKVYKAIEPRRAVNEHEDNGVATLHDASMDWMKTGYVDPNDLKVDNTPVDPDADLVPNWNDDIHHLF